MYDVDELVGIGAELVDAGVGVFPVALAWNEAKGAIDKRPATVHGHLDATTDLTVLERMIAAARLHEDEELGVGFVPGPAGYVALDCDVKHGRAGRDTLTRLEVVHGEFVKAAWTSPSGGLNVLCRKPPGACYSNRSPWDGIDVRADGGWLVAPGVRCSWGEWRWHIGELADAAVLPAGMAAELSAGGTYGRPVNAKVVVEFLERSPVTSSLAARTMFDGRLAEFAATKHGSRHEALKSLLGWTFGMGALDLRRAMADIVTVWECLVPGEGRDAEPWDLARWVVAQELRGRNGDGPAAAKVRDEPPALPDELWTARPLFQHIRSAAYARTVSAPALLAAVLVRALAHTPPELVLPPIIGAEASLNMFVLCVAPSGLGKSVGHAYAGDLLDVTAAPELVERPLGSGEGLTEVFFDWVVEDDGSGKKVKVRRQVRSNALFFADEGTVLSELAARSGSTLLSQLRLAWSGQLLGQTNAAAERRRILDPHSYRLCLMMGIQPGNAAGLLADEASGTPQRFLWVSALDETVPDLELMPKWPGRLPWAVPKLPDGPVDVDRRIVTELRRQHVERHHGAPVAALDSHAGLVRLKVAAGFGLLDRRHSVTVDDWALAGTVMRYSNAVRDATVAAVRLAARQVDDVRTARAVRTQQALDVDAERRALERAVRAAASIVRRHADEHSAQGGGCTRRCITLAVKGRDRTLVDIDTVIAEATIREWLVVREDRLFVGKRQP